MSNLIENHGKDLCKEIKGILVYEIDVGNTKLRDDFKDYGQKRVIVLDLKNKYLMGKKHGHIYLENYETLNHNKRVGDAIMKMSLNTFDQLSNKEISGFRAVISGKLKFTGSLGLI